MRKYCKYVCTSNIENWWGNNHNWPNDNPQCKSNQKCSWRYGQNQNQSQSPHQTDHNNWNPYNNNFKSNIFWHNFFWIEICAIGRHHFSQFGWINCFDRLGVAFQNVSITFENLQFTVSFNTFFDAFNSRFQTFDPARWSYSWSTGLAISFHKFKMTQNLQHLFQFFREVHPLTFIHF